MDIDFSVATLRPELPLLAEHVLNNLSCNDDLAELCICVTVLCRTSMLREIPFRMDE
jgi:hypothetical protein